MEDTMFNEMIKELVSNRAVNFSDFDYVDELCDSLDININSLTQNQIAYIESKIMCR